jgi:hypothetical protein
MFPEFQTEEHGVPCPPQPPPVRSLSAALTESARLCLAGDLDGAILVLDAAVFAAKSPFVSFAPEH